MQMTIRIAATLCLATALGACSTMSTISSPTPGTRLSLKDATTLTLPASKDLRGTSFGNYEFEAVDAGHDPFFGILPLQFKGGHLALDIIFFAPATMFNLRGAFPFYEIDVEQGVIRYKASKEAAWSEYRPNIEEIDRARAYFDDAAARPSGGTAK